MSAVMRAALNVVTMQAYGVTKEELPPRIRGMHRCLARGAYRGFRKGYKAYLRFARAVRDFAAEKARKVAP